MRISISLPFEWQRFDRLPKQLELEEVFGLNKHLDTADQGRLSEIGAGLEQCLTVLPPEMQRATQLLSEKIDILFESLTAPTPPVVQPVSLSHEGVSFERSSVAGCAALEIGDYIGVRLVLACGQLLCPAKVTNVDQSTAGAKFQLRPVQERMLSRYLLSERPSQ
ncbi:MAG: hypothetical protein GKR90_05630 [Pseudomonadales bacterium]|nr:hypothetical protein [Pseudomonadales bacterium]